MKRLARLTLLPPATIAVHQLRYVLAFGSHAGGALEPQGHAHLQSLLPWIVVVLAAGMGAFTWALG